ncbi:hypothetical protein [Treponema sp.]|uniref:hypothetical protein n=1 Tax=Treponema sp. TaxID=166 RepID=UPI00298E2CED|nr:hypothetical protein [Treponema sp.]MCQ2242341.1 hypothetical protein [Treponema sp.]
MWLIAIIRDLEKAFGVVFAFFLISGIVFLVKPEKEAVVEEETVVQSIYPFESRASQVDGKGPNLYITVKNGFLNISPLVNSSFDYELCRLVYFGEETEPCGFEMILTDYSGKKQKILFHRGKSGFHTNWKYKIHYSDEATMEKVKDIVIAANKNIFCFESSEI